MLPCVGLYFDCGFQSANRHNSIFFLVVPAEISNAANGKITTEAKRLQMRACVVTALCARLVGRVALYGI